MKKIIIVIALYLFSIHTTTAEESPKQALNICAVAIPLFNQYIINYEYVHKNLHGMNFRAEYAPMSSRDIDATGLAVALNYRWHVFETFDSLFLGIYGRYRDNSGSGAVDNVLFEFERPEVTAGVNAGKRWTWDSGFNALFSLGLGKSIVRESFSTRNAAIDTAFSQFKEDNPTFIDAAFYGELSFGYAF